MLLSSCRSLFLDLGSENIGIWPHNRPTVSRAGSLLARTRDHGEVRLPHGKYSHLRGRTKSTVYGDLVDPGDSKIDGGLCPG